MNEARTSGESLSRRSPWLKLVALLAVMFLVMAACDGDDDGDAADDGATTTQAEDDGEDDGDGDGDGAAADVESELFQRAQEEGITLGIADEVPFGFVDPDTGEPTGQAPVVAQEVLSRLGITEIDSQVVDFGALIDGLNAGRFDMIAAGMFITEDRAAQAAFTDPDYCVGNAFAVPEGNPEGLTDISSVIDSGATVGVLSGAVEEGYLVDSGVPDDQISRFDTQADMVDALTSGRIDAFMLTAISVRDQVSELDGFEATETFIPVVNGEDQVGCGGYVFSFDNIDARNEFNEVLLEMRENDEIAPLVSEFPLFEEINAFEAAKGRTVEDLIGQPFDAAVNGGDE